MMNRFEVNSVRLRGSNLIEASAGTGKTYALANLYVRLLLQRQLKTSQILVVTFTEAATAELRDRIRRRIREALSAFHSSATGRDVGDPDLAQLVRQERSHDAAVGQLQRALTDFDSAEISTIHGFCQRVLQESSFGSKLLFNSELLTDTRSLINNAVLDFWSQRLEDADPDLVRYLREQAHFTTSSAQSLIEAVQRSGQVQLEPARPEQLSDLDLSSARAAFARARDAWSEPEVAAALNRSVLNRRQYQARFFGKWFRETAEYFSGSFSLNLPERFSRLTTSELAEHAKGRIEPHPYFDAADDLCAALGAATKQLSQHTLRLQHDLVEHVTQALDSHKRTSGVLSFDDLLRFLHRALKDADGEKLADRIRQRFHVALIDEFQDTDPVQYEIFWKIFGQAAASLFMIGDPKQAIYSFRGADIFAYVRAAQDTEDQARFTMGTNYRSDSAMVHAVNQLFSECPRPFLMEELTFQSVVAHRQGQGALRNAQGTSASGGALQFLFVQRGEQGKKPDVQADNTEVCRIVTTRIQDLLETVWLQPGTAHEQRRRLEPRDVAVLTRTNAQAFAVQQELRAAGIASVVLGDKSIYETAEARDLQRVLAAILDPGHPRLLRTALASELVGLTATQVDELQRDEDLAERWSTMFRHYHDQWVRFGFIRMFHQFLVQCDIQERLLSLSNGERRLTNLLQLSELLHDASSSEHLGPAGLLHYLARERGRRIYRPDTEQIRLESDELAVKITTVHKSKGLEYPVVFCPFAWHDILSFSGDRFTIRHDPSQENAAILHLGGEGADEHRQRVDWEQMAENLRLLYVALTRAKHRCYVVWGRLGKFTTSALGYLLHPPPGSELLAPNIEQIKKHLGGLSDELMLARLQALVESAAKQRPASPDSASNDSASNARATRNSELPLGVSVADASAIPQRSTHAAKEPSVLAARSLSRPVPRDWRISSFSSLVGHQRGVKISDEWDEAPQDHDELIEVQPDAPLGGAPTEVLLAEFPRGPEVGNFFHELLEHGDFTQPADAWLPEIRSRLTRYGHEPERWEALVARAIDQFVATPLGSSPQRNSLRLKDVSLTDRMNELEFYLPVQANATRNGLSAANLSQAFRNHPSPELAATYAESLVGLQFADLRGYLKGYVDLVFRAQGKWYVVDYKTNHLGNSTDDYGRLSLQTAMAQHHYYLQYHLYTLAVDRYLRTRLSNYDYERDFGGVYYLFLRGMSPDTAQEAGVFFERPPATRLAALGTVLDG